MSIRQRQNRDQPDQPRTPKPHLSETNCHREQQCKVIYMAYIYGHIYKPYIYYRLYIIWFIYIPDDKSNNDALILANTTNYHSFTISFTIYIYQQIRLRSPPHTRNDCVWNIQPSSANRLPLCAGHGQGFANLQDKTIRANLFDKTTFLIENGEGKRLVNEGA